MARQKTGYETSDYNYHESEESGPLGCDAVWVGG
jgi:hypothetical protein